MNTTSANGEELFWYEGETYSSYNTGLAVKEETFWYEGETVIYLMSDPTDGNFFFFF
jgi:hypothetical protein